MKKNKKNKQQINYLDLIPVRPEKLGWHIDRRERVVLEVQILESYHFISFKNMEK